MQRIACWRLLQGESEFDEGTGEDGGDGQCLDVAFGSCEERERCFQHELRRAKEFENPRDTVPALLLRCVPKSLFLNCP